MSGLRTVPGYRSDCRSGGTIARYTGGGRALGLEAHALMSSVSASTTNLGRTGFNRDERRATSDERRATSDERQEPTSLECLPTCSDALIAERDSWLPLHRARIAGKLCERSYDALMP